MPVQIKPSHEIDLASDHGGLMHFDPVGVWWLEWVLPRMKGLGKPD